MNLKLVLNNEMIIIKCIPYQKKWFKKRNLNGRLMKIHSLHGGVMKTLAMFYWYMTVCQMSIEINVSVCWNCVKIAFWEFLGKSVSLICLTTCHKVSNKTSTKERGGWRDRESMLWKNQDKFNSSKYKLGRVCRMPSVKIGYLSH